MGVKESIESGRAEGAELEQTSAKDSDAVFGVPLVRWGFDRAALTARLSYGTYVSRAHRYLYVETPKVACTTIKTLIHGVERLPPVPPFLTPETRRSMFIHGRRGFRMPSLADLAEDEGRAVLTSPEVLRFAVVRNPYARLFSAWRNKIHLVEPGFEPTVAAMRRAMPKWKGGMVPFRRFVRYLADNESPTTCNAHWMNQETLLMPRAIPYTFIGRLESFDAAMQRLLTHLDAQGATAVPSPRPRNSSPREDWRAAYDAETAALVHRFSQGDFEEFGYDRDSWQRNTPPPPSPGVDELRAHLEEEIFERNRVISMLYAERMRLQAELQKARAKLRSHLPGVDSGDGP